MGKLLTRAIVLLVASQAAPGQTPTDRDRLADRLEQQLNSDRALASWGLLQHGSLAVGYRDEGAVHYWYPSRSGPAMILADYVDPGEFDAYGASIGDLLEARMYASHAATPLAGPYPLIVVPDGYPNRSLFAETAEYLASHGFVVAWLPLAHAGPDQTLAAAAAACDAIAHPAADRERVALWGYQRGGGIALALQDHVRAAAIVSIEGSEAWIDTAWGVPALRERLARVRGAAPVLRFQSNRATPPEHPSALENTTLEFYRGYHGTLEEVEIDGVSHDQLSALAVWANVARLTQPSAGAIEAHRLIAERSLAFITAHTKPRPPAN